MIDYNLALNYALDTYVRRDLLFVMGKIYGQKKKKPGDKDFVIKHLEIEEWIKEQYEDEE